MADELIPHVETAQALLELLNLDMSENQRCDE
jgi:hypothetical protein